MIVRILAKSKTFKGVRYNTNKVDENKGELMKISGFGALQGITKPRPSDYINYLQMISVRNKRIQYQQFHAVISAKGKSTSKEELTTIATEWLEKMGYGKQPYLIIFHKDTRNHHVHIVSTRVDKSSGKMISSAYERIRAMTAMNQVMKLDEQQVAKDDLDWALAFNFSTTAQLMMILQGKGYTMIEENGKLFLIKFGRKLQEVELSKIKERLLDYQPELNRANQLRAILNNYRFIHSGVLRSETSPLPGGRVREKASYISDLAIFMKEKFDVQLVFQPNPGKPAYGYTLLDYAQGNVFKGTELMDLSVLTEQLDSALQQPLPPWAVFTTNTLYSVYEQLDDLLPLTLNGSCSPEHTFTPHEAAIGIYIFDDIDDEAIHGRKRQKRTKSR